MLSLLEVAPDSQSRESMLECTKLSVRTLCSRSWTALPKLKGPLAQKPSEMSWLRHKEMEH